MLPQYMALSASQLVSFVKKNLCVCLLGYIVGAPPPPVKICVSVRWVTFWVRPPLCEYMCVRALGYIVDASPPLCVRSIGNTVGASRVAKNVSLCGNIDSLANISPEHDSHARP